MTQKTGVGQAGPFGPAMTLMLVMMVSSCMGGDLVTRSDMAPDAAAHLDAKGAVISPLIADLQARQSLLPQASAFAALRDQILEESTGAAAAELRVKRLTAKVRSKNWLPKLGTDLSLSALGAVVAQLVLDQGLLDNGYRKAERDFAAADVEVAAVALVQDLNQRVFEGLKLYIEAARASELVAINQAALQRMNEFERIMGIRVEGGLSDRSDYRVIAQKRAEFQAALSAAEQGRDTALAELAVRAGRAVALQKGGLQLPKDSGHPTALSVLAAQAESARALAEINMARAGMRPGLGLRADIDRKGDVDAGLRLSGDFLDFARDDSLAALSEAETLAARKIEEAERDSEARLVALNRERIDLDVQMASEGRILAEMEANLSLFGAQYKAGRMSLLELSSQFERLVALRRSHAALKYQMAVVALDIGRLRGILVDGSQI